MVLAEKQWTFQVPVCYWVEEASDIQLVKVRTIPFSLDQILRNIELMLYSEMNTLAQ